MVCASSMELTQSDPETKHAECDKLHVEKCLLLPSWRLAVTLVCTWAGAATMFSRIQASFAITCMVRPPPGNNTETDQLGSVTSDASGYHQGEFAWSKQFEGVVLSAYFCGYMASLVFGGWIADQSPGHWTVIGSALTQAVIMSAIPEVTRINSNGIVVLRVLQGIATSTLFPGISVTIRNWSAEGEYTLLFGIVHAGSYFGSAAAFPVSSVLCQSGLLGGWPAVFYISAVVQASCAILAVATLRGSPEHHPFVSENEQKHLLHGMPARDTVATPRQPVSIRALVTNLQVWIISLAYFSTSWLFTSLSITLPTFMKEGFNFDIEKNGLMSALPSVGLGVAILFAGKARHYLHVNTGISGTRACKIFSTIGTLGPSMLLGLVIMLPREQRYVSAILICLAQALAGLLYCAGPMGEVKRIAPQCIGLVWGFAGSVGNVAGVLAPLIAAALTPEGTLAEWNTFFAISIALMVLLGMLIVVCWKSETQLLHRPEPVKGES